MRSQTLEAIARIEVADGAEQIVSRGTGFLVADSYVLTALHVICDRRKQPPPPRGARYEAAGRDPHDPTGYTRRPTAIARSRTRR